MKKIKLLIVALTALFTMLSCDNDNMDELSFVGDSEVARWDLQHYFPTRIVRNYGRSGAGIEYVESLAGQFKEQTVVVIIGTNDLHFLIDGDADQYVARYVEAVMGLGAIRIYLYSIFPRNFDSDTVDFNGIIRPLNEKIRSAFAAYETVCYLPVFDDLYSADTESINWQFTYDGLHLNDLGYELITKKLIDCI